MQEHLDGGEQDPDFDSTESFDRGVPRESVVDKVGRVGVPHMRRLQVDGVESARDGVVEQRHVGHLLLEHPGQQLLRPSLVGSPLLARAVVDAKVVRGEQAHGPVGPGPVAPPGVEVRGMGRVRRRDELHHRRERRPFEPEQEDHGQQDQNDQGRDEVDVGTVQCAVDVPGNNLAPGRPRERWVFRLQLGVVRRRKRRFAWFGGGVRSGGPPLELRLAARLGLASFWRRHGRGIESSGGMRNVD